MSSPYEYTLRSDPQEPLHCGSCLKVVAELFACYWDSSLKVGACCLIHSDELDQYGQGLCSQSLVIAEHSHSVEEFSTALKAHVAECAACLSTRKTVQSDRVLLQQPGSVCCEGKEVA